MVRHLWGLATCNIRLDVFSRIAYGYKLTLYDFVILLQLKRNNHFFKRNKYECK